MSRLSWFVLIISLALVALSAGQLLYRATIPTDGWLVHAGSVVAPEGPLLVYDMPLTTQPTPLRPGDRVFAVEGYLVDPLRLDLGLGETAARARWRAGLPLRYWLWRDGKTVFVDVPPLRWTFAAWSRYMTTSVERAANTLATAILFGVALLVFARRHNRPGSRALLLLGAALLAQWISASLPDGVSVIIHPAARALTIYFTYSVFIVVITPTVLLFALTFPQPRGWARRYPWLLALIYLPPWLAIWVIANTRRVEVGWLCAVIYVIIAIGVLAHSLATTREPVSRAQVQWAGMGLIIGLALSLLTYLAVFGLFSPPWDAYLRAGASAGMVIAGIAMAIALLRYRLFDIDLIVRRTLLYSLVTATLAGVFLASIVVLQGGFVSLTGQRSQAAVAFSTLAIAALFNPLRLRLQEWIDRRFYRSAYDPDRIVTAFGRIAQNETDLALITDEMMNVIRDTVQPTFAGLWLAQPRDAHGHSASNGVSIEQ